jgi:hypothetical protein
VTLAIVRALEKETPDASGVTGSYVWGFPKDNAQPQILPWLCHPA